MKITCTIFLLFLFTVGKGQTIHRLDTTTISSGVLDKKIHALMQSGKVHGMAIAIFNRNKVVYKKTFGYKNMTTKEPIHTSSNYYGASLSKAVFAVLVLKFVEEGKLDLDKPLQEYLDQPIYTYTPQTKWHDDYRNLKSDTLYQRITARMCLSHTSGFPNWRWDLADQKLRVEFIPGSRYSYSGEGLVYLQVVMEKKFGKSLESMMKEKIFKPLGMNHSSYTWQPLFEKDYVFGHGTQGEVLEKDKDNEARSASTMETTLDDYAKFIQAVLQNKLLKPATTQLMFTPQLRLRSVQQFGPLRFRDTATNDHLDLGYGLGWGLLHAPVGWGAFKEGHGDGFQHYSILFPSKGTGVVILTNSDNGEGIFKELLALTIGDRYTPWYWQNYIPYNVK